MATDRLIASILICTLEDSELELIFGVWPLAQSSDMGCHASHSKTLRYTQPPLHHPFLSPAARSSLLCLTNVFLFEYSVCVLLIPHMSEGLAILC